MLGFWNKNLLLFSGPSQGSPWSPWSPSVSKSVLGLNELRYPQLLIDRSPSLPSLLPLIKKQSKTIREFYQEPPFSSYIYKSYVNEHKCHIFESRKHSVPSCPVPSRALPCLVVSSRALPCLLVSSRAIVV